MIYILDSGRKKERKAERTNEREHEKKTEDDDDDDENDNLECLPFFLSDLFISFKDVICFLRSPMLIKMNIHLISLTSEKSERIFKLGLNN